MVRGFLISDNWIWEEKKKKNEREEIIEIIRIRDFIQ